MTKFSQLNSFHFDQIYFILYFDVDYKLSFLFYNPWILHINTSIDTYINRRENDIFNLPKKQGIMTRIHVVIFSKSVRKFNLCYYFVQFLLKCSILRVFTLQRHDILYHLQYFLEFDISFFLQAILLLSIHKLTIFTYLLFLWNIDMNGHYDFNINLTFLLVSNRFSPLFLILKFHLYDCFASARILTVKNVPSIAFF